MLIKVSELKPKSVKLPEELLESLAESFIRSIERQAREGVLTPEKIREIAAKHRQENKRKGYDDNGKET